MRTFSTLLIALALFAPPATRAAAAPPAQTLASVFQYAVPLKAAKKPGTAFLWLPPEARHVRGVVMTGMTLMEREFVKDPVIRRACADEQLAIVFLTVGLSAVDVQAVLDDLAAASGYRELAGAPLLFVGHSAGGPQAKALAIRMADRCVGLMQYRGGVPGGADPVPAGVPALMMVGQFDEFGGTMRAPEGREAWASARDGLHAFRATGDGSLGSLVVEPGAGHFAWSDRNAAYLATFIRKAAKARIPDGPPADAGDAPATPVKCKAIDPAAGWLTDWSAKSLGELKAAPHAAFAGDRSKAAWHFDREMAEATVACHAGGFGKRDQFIRWTDPAWVDAGVRYFFNDLRWVGDGQTFEVRPVYADTYPQPLKGGPRWPQAGEPVGHSSAPILVRHVGGPVVAAGPNALRFRFDALSPATEGGRATFIAYSAGDAEYRYTEQVGMTPRGLAGLKQGKPQAITFPPIEGLRADGPPVALRATSDAGLPVEYYVAHGPAVVEDGKLRVADLPARAAFPIEVKVVAWQFGRGVEPLVQSATPVEQTVKVERP